jgi:tetratricopeptide (TPR) repeat protein
VRRGLGLAALVLGLLSCHDPPSSPPAEGGGSSRSEGTRAQAARRTTDGGIAVGNLEAQLAANDRVARSHEPSVPERASQVEMLLMHGQYLGRIDDYERATTLADALAHDAPTEGRVFITRARVLLTWHRFDAALADLDHAEALGARGAGSDAVRAGVLQAVGRYDEALALRRHISVTGPDVLALGAEAAVLAERGDLDLASSTFAAAERAYPDVSPFPIAWLRYQEGAMWLRAGDLERARPLLQEAVDRLPAYAPAEGLLAQLDAAAGRRDAAIARLSTVAAASDDPDYAAQLARILGEAGRPEEATTWRERAKARFAELLAAHEEAFADHAADFWLNAGGDAQRGVALARRNAALRSTPRAYELLLQGALATNDAALGCEAADGASRAPYRWPRLQALVTRAYRACGRYPES